MSAEFAIECRNLVKVFPGTRALDGVDLQVRHGEIHALLGQNGAGKSTLIRAIAGADPPTSGSIFVEGAEVRIDSPQMAQSFGVAVVHQHFNLAADLSVQENLFLGHDFPRRWNGLVDWRALTEKARGLLDRLGLKIDPRANVGDLRPDELAMIAIARAVASEAKVIILDEPTAALLPDEVAVLFAHIRRLSAEGHAFLYVSHRLSEVFEIADRITVLRDGRRIGAWPLAETTRAAVIAAIVGSNKAEVDEVRPTEASRGAIVLSVTNAASEGVKNFTFALRAGEVVGFAGLPGSGAEEAVAMIYGRQPLQSGALELDGKAHSFRSVRDAKAAGLALIPKDRHGEAMLSGLTVRENISLPILDKFIIDPVLRLMRAPRERRHAEQIASTLSIKTTGVDTPDRQSQWRKSAEGNSWPLARGAVPDLSDDGADRRGGHRGEGRNLSSNPQACCRWRGHTLHLSGGRGIPAGLQPRACLSRRRCRRGTDGRGSNRNADHGNRCGEPVWL